MTLLGEPVDSHASGEVRSEVAKAARGRATDPEAHRLNLLARHLLDRDAHGDTAKAIGYLQQALERDPECALAWAELSRAFVRESDSGLTPPAEGYSRAREAAERALQLEPDLPEGHSALGWIRMSHDWDWRGAEQSYARAMELAPRNAQALRGAATVAGNLGRIDEAILLYRQVMEQDPLSPSAYHSLGSRLHAADRFEEAEQSFRKVLELAPQKMVAHAFLAMPLLDQGRADEALAVARQEPDEVFRLWSLAIVHDAMGHAAESEEALRELIEKRAGDSAFQVAEVYARRNAADDALEWLERARAQRDGGLVSLKVSPHLRSLHGDPRWAAFMKKVGFDG